MREQMSVLNLVRDAAKTFPPIAEPMAVKSARIWYCKYSSCASLGACLNLEELVIAGLPDENLDFLRPLQKLKILFILHMPKITSVSPVSGLENLETLSLATKSLLGRWWQAHRHRQPGADRAAAVS